LLRHDELCGLDPRAPCLGRGAREKQRVSATRAKIHLRPCVVLFSAALEARQGSHQVPLTSKIAGALQTAPTTQRAGAA